MGKEGQNCDHGQVQEDGEEPANKSDDLIASRRLESHLIFEDPHKHAHAVVQQSTIIAHQKHAQKLRLARIQLWN